MRKEYVLPAKQAKHLAALMHSTSRLHSLYLAELASKARRERENAEALRLEHERKIEVLKGRIRHSATVTPIGEGRILGKGGKQLKAVRSSELGVRSGKKGVSA